MLDVGPANVLTPSRRSRPYIGGFCNFRLLLVGVGIVDATSRRSSRSVGARELLSLGLEKIVELYVGIFDVFDAAVGWTS